MNATKVNAKYFAMSRNYATQHPLSQATSSPNDSKVAW